MAKTYTLYTWIDEILGGGARYDILEDGGGAFKADMQILLSTAVSTAGSELTAARMNNIEGAIDAIDTLLRAVPTEKTVSSGVLTVDQSRHSVQPESGTADDIATISGIEDGTLLALTVSDDGTDTLTYKHGTGNLSCFGGVDIDHTTGLLLLFRDGAKVYIISGGSGSGAGDVIGPATHSAFWVPQWNGTPDSKTLIDGFYASLNGISLIGAANYAAMKALLDLEIGTDVQAYDADLDTWATVTSSANGRSLVSAANYAAMKVLLDLEDSDIEALAAGVSIANVVEDTTPQLGGALEVLEFGIILDDALSADGKFSGIVENGTAGAVLAFGDLCYFAVADSKWELADADAEATAGPVKLGICVLAASEDAATQMLLIGKVRADTAFPTLTIGAPAYVGTTAGDIQIAAPSGSGDIVRVLGHANTANEFYFNPSNNWIELS